MPTTKSFFVFGLLLLIVSIIIVFCKTDNLLPVEKVKQTFDKRLFELQQAVNVQLFDAVEKGKEHEMKTAFLAARKKYKSIEFYIEYFFPSTAVMLNGAPIDEIELGENLIENPTGFQVMEELIYDGLSFEKRLQLLNEVKIMKLNLARVARYNQQYKITDAQIFDAIRLELFRITALGISGFDSPIALQSIPEAAAALDGIYWALNIYKAEKVCNQINDAIRYLGLARSFNDFDRLSFIVDYLQPIGRQTGQLRKNRQIATASSQSAFSEEAYSMFEVDAFNLNKFVGNSAMFINDEKIALGKILFNDAILSNGGNRSCQTCHHQAIAFTDGLTKPKSISGKSLLRNTPTLTYAGLQRAFFYDLKAGSLEDQALDVIHNKEEMNGSLKEAAKRINQSEKYRLVFQKAYPESVGKATPWKIQHALAGYIRSLSPFTSRVDFYMRGDKTKLNQTEKEGFNLFMGKAKCGTCHFVPLFSGTQAPLFIKSEAEVIGVPSKPDTVRAVIDADLGRYGLYEYQQYKYAFKTPTLRNISKTAPYMHNGVYSALEQVIDFYNRGGGAGIGINLENQTLPTDKLNLSKKEISAIAAFLKALDDG